jgi:hypothetical protein
MMVLLSLVGGKYGVQVKMKDIFPHAHFIHCCAYHLNLVMKQACSTVKSVNMFLSICQDFRPFFPHHLSIRFVDNCLWLHCPEVCGNVVELSKQNCELSVY